MIAVCVMPPESEESEGREAMSKEFPDRAGQDRHDADLIADDVPVLELDLASRKALRAGVAGILNEELLDSIYGADSR